MRAPAAAKAAQITRRQLLTWVELGYLKPNPRPEGAGSGYPHEFSAREIEILHRMGQLTRLGIRPADAAALARGSDHALVELDAALRRCHQPLPN